MSLLRPAGQWATAASLFERAQGLDSERRTELLAAESPEVASLAHALLESFDGTLALFPGRKPETFLAGWESALALPAEDAVLTPGERIGRFTIQELLGTGGMGRVYLAADLALGRPTALKILHQGSGESLVAQLRAEAEALGRLQHPGIASFYEAATDAGQAYVAMEFVKGPTLRHRLQHDPPSLDEGLALGAALLEALIHAHGAGLVHRDLKPQ
ncbi:MAG TPA: protein kinase, partial [Myxococcaceae bacterium]